MKSPRKVLGKIIEDDVESVGPGNAWGRKQIFMKFSNYK